MLKVEVWVLVLFEVVLVCRSSFDLFWEGSHSQSHCNASATTAAAAAVAVAGDSLFLESVATQRSLLLLCCPVCLSVSLTLSFTVHGNADDPHAFWCCTCQRPPVVRGEGLYIARTKHMAMQHFNAEDERGELIRN